MIAKSKILRFYHTNVVFSTFASGAGAVRSEYGVIPIAEHAFRSGRRSVEAITMVYKNATGWRRSCVMNGRPLKRVLLNAAGSRSAI